MKLNESIQQNNRFRILVYILGCCFFHTIAAFNLWLSLLKNDFKKATAIALQYDDAANVATNGRADVKISTRIWLRYQSNPSKLKYQLMLRLVDGIFEKLNNEQKHCHNSYLGDRARGSI